MPCGVTKVVDGVTVTCDNAAANPHSGTQHSGLISGAYWGWVNRRVWWTATDARPSYRRTIAIGDKD